VRKIKDEDILDAVGSGEMQIQVGPSIDDLLGKVPLSRGALHPRLVRLERSGYIKKTAIGWVRTGRTLPLDDGSMRLIIAGKHVARINGVRMSGDRVTIDQVDLESVDIDVLELLGGHSADGSLITFEIVSINDGKSKTVARFLPDLIESLSDPVAIRSFLVEGVVIAPRGGQCPTS
jgi:hypothetical protein